MGDVMVLFALALAIFRHREGQAGTVFSVFAAGMFVVLASDLGFAYASNAGTYETGSLLDAGWVVGFLLMGYGGLLQYVWRPQYATQSDDLSDPAWKQGLPLVVMIAITSWIIIDGFDGHSAGLPLVAAVLLMMCAVVVRHYLTLRENIELRSVLEQAYRAESHRARTDVLTGKLSRRAVLEAVDGLLRTSPPRVFAIGMVDIDGMKRINDGFGHQCGDEALSAVASALEPGAVVGRYGGDEFIVILEDAGLTEVGEYRNAVSATLAAWTTARTDGLELTVSLGFAFAPLEGDATADLIGLADRRMYDVKDIKHVVSRGASAA
jgi:diguanylate cyclase (GGDEF)-like protein